MHLRENTAFKASAAVLFFLLLAAGSARATAVVVPGSAAATEGNDNNGFPFNIGAFGISSQRYQQVYSAAAFSAPLSITDILFRPDAFTGSAFSSTLGSVEIDLSTTSAAVDALSSTFANNVGGDDAIVFNGALSLSSSFTGPAGGPKDFDILIHLTTPFLYNPANGNLLMDVRNFNGGTTTPFDSVNTAGDAVSRALTFSGGVNSPTADGGVNTTGLVTEFLGTSIPEPGSLALLLSGGLALAALRYRPRLRP